MPTPPTPQQPTREYVSLSELAEDILGLSRARCYELIARGALPQPIYDLRTRRPLFNAELQQMARTVKLTGVGIDGSPILFYRRGRAPQAVAPAPRQRGSGRNSTRYAELVSSLRGLGVSNADEQSVAAAVAESFPNGIDGQQEADVIRAVFRLLRSRRSA